jgi:hypothetical protein
MRHFIEKVSCLRVGIGAMVWMACLQPLRDSLIEKNFFCLNKTFLSWTPGVLHLVLICQTKGMSGVLTQLY